MKIRDCLTPAPTIQCDAPVTAAIDLISQHGLRIIPVVDRDRRFIGHLNAADGQIISHDPILKDSSEFHLTQYGTSVVEVDAPFEQAIRIFKECPQAESLVVLSRGRVEGLLMREAVENTASTPVASATAQSSLPKLRRAFPAQYARLADPAVFVETAPDSSIWLG